jgi:hypothetical protein
MPKPNPLSTTCWLFFFIITVAPAAFSQTNTRAPVTTNRFPPNVGDIDFDPALDDSAFVVCDPKVVLQYYNTPSYYKNHRRAIELYFRNHYRPPANAAGQNGYCTIRFIINCKGQTGRFRIYELDTHYQPYTFDKQITSRLLQLTKAIQGWEPAAYKSNTYDSYQYITFKLQKGAIACITP